MKQTTKPEQAKHRSKIGGQALIEGIMMRGPKKQSVVAAGWND